MQCSWGKAKSGSGIDAARPVSGTVFTMVYVIVWAVAVGAGCRMDQKESKARLPLQKIMFVASDARVGIQCGQRIIEAET